MLRIYQVRHISDYVRKALIYNHCETPWYTKIVHCQKYQMIGKRCEHDDISNFSQALSDRPVAPFFQWDQGALYLERKTAN